LETIEEAGERQRAVARIARSPGMGVKSLRNWVHQAEIDRGSRAGLATEECRRIVELRTRTRVVATLGHFIISSLPEEAAEAVVREPGKRV